MARLKDGCVKSARGVIAAEIASLAPGKTAPPEVETMTRRRKETPDRFNHRSFDLGRGLHDGPTPD